MGTFDILNTELTVDIFLPHYFRFCVLLFQGLYANIFQPISHLMPDISTDFIIRNMKIGNSPFFYTFRWKDGCSRCRYIILWLLKREYLIELCIMKQSSMQECKVVLLASLVIWTTTIIILWHNIKLVISSLLLYSRCKFSKDLCEAGILSIRLTPESEKEMA